MKGCVVAGVVLVVDGMEQERVAKWKWSQAIDEMQLSVSLQFSMYGRMKQRQCQRHSSLLIASVIKVW